jgi:hypothetical protein
METTAKKIKLVQLFYPFKTWWAFLLVNLGVGLTIAVLFDSDPANLGDWLTGVAWGTVISLTQWLGHAWIATKIDQHISWLEAPLTRALVAVFSMVIYTVVAFLVVQLSLRFILYGDFPREIGIWIINNSLVPLIFSFLIGWSMAARGFYVSWKEAAQDAQSLKIEMLNYRYEALRNQLNPHFLFNSFNVLSDLVYEDQDLAVKFIRQLSDLYRYVLDSREKELVPLQEELDFIQAFVFLLKTRFEDKIDIQIDLSAQVDEMIVPMTLQLLVENAVKHNEASKKHPLLVTILRVDGQIEVRNSLKIRSVGDDSKGTGLKNIRQQYAHLSKSEIEVEQTESEFVVRIPILKKAIA